MSAEPAIRIVSWGGLGDALLTTPCFRALKRQHPHRRLVVYCRTGGHFALFRHNPSIDRLKPPGARSLLEQTLVTCLGATLREPAYGRLRPSLFYSTSAADIIAEMLGVTLEDRFLEIFLQPDEEAIARRLLAPYAVPVAIHVTSRASPNQHWPMAYWAELVRRNPRITFIQLGVADETSVAGAVDLRGKLPIRHALAVLKHAHAFVGVVSVFAHATCAVGTPGVVFYGPSAAVIWGHPSNHNLDAHEPCAPCIDLLGGQSCPYGSRCMTAISVRDVENALYAQLESSDARAR